MEMNMAKFSEKLHELVEMGKKKKNVLEYKEINEVLKDMETYIAFSMTDIDRNIWMYNDNSYDEMTKGIGKKTFKYACELNHINECKLRLGVSIRNAADEPFAFSDQENSPVIIVSPRKNRSKSERIASSGILTSNGSWQKLK